MNSLLLYARAAAPLVPGASRLPLIPGGGGELPELTLTRSDVTAEDAALAAYAKLCSFQPSDSLPLTYPHILAFPLQMELMCDGSFPFAPIGLVHIANEITQIRAIRPDERLALEVSACDVAPHPRGRTFTLLTRVSAGGKLVWQERSTMLRRGGGAGEAPRAGEAAARSSETAGLPAISQWRLAGDLGRRYGAVSGDRNPIHMHDLTARLFGFKHAIAHGMWTKARCVAALDPPAACTVAVRFQRPISLPGTVEFAAEDGAFEVRSDGASHLSGKLR